MTHMKRIPTVESLKKRRHITIGDLMAKAENEDWHGVADAAMDLREIDSQLELLEVQKNQSLDLRTQNDVVRQG